MTQEKKHKYSKPNYEFKAQILKSDIYKEFLDARKQDYFESAYYGVVKPDNLDNLFIAKTFEGKQNEFLECEKILNAKKHRSKHLNRKIFLMMEQARQSNKKVYFLTLTFTDEVLATTSQETRRKYISRYLKQIEGQTDYVANIDFGVIEDYEDFKGNIRKGTNREHYHAVICCDYVNLKKWHKYGFMNYKISGLTKEDQTREAQYISKLTNHALKDSCRLHRLIYSRRLFDCGLAVANSSK